MIKFALRNISGYFAACKFSILQCNFFASFIISHSVENSMAGCEFYLFIYFVFHYLIKSISARKLLMPCFSYVFLLFKFFIEVCIQSTGTNIFHKIPLVYFNLQAYGSEHTKSIYAYSIYYCQYVFELLVYCLLYSYLVAFAIVAEHSYYIHSQLPLLH